MRKWPFLDAEVDLDDKVRTAAAQLGDLLNRETFYKDVREISRAARSIEIEHKHRFDEALTEKNDAYEDA